MGQKVSESTHIAASPEAIRAVILDLAAYPEWADGVQSIDVLTTDEQGRPDTAKFHVDAKVAQITYTIAYTHTEDAVSWTLIEGEMMSQLDGSYRMTLRGQGTDVVYTVEADISIPLPGFMKKRAAKQIVETGLAGLKKRAQG